MRALLSDEPATAQQKLKRDKQKFGDVADISAYFATSSAVKKSVDTPHPKGIGAAGPKKSNKPRGN